MTSSDVVTGGQEPARHHKLVRPLLGAAIGCLSFALVFTSGYLLGSNGTPQQSATAVEFNPRSDAGLAVPGGGAERAIHSAQHRGNSNGKPVEGAPTKRKPTRFITVQDGDSLWKIAASVAPRADAAATVELISRLNSLGESAQLEIGQRLAVPVADDNARPKQREADTNSRPKHREKEDNSRPKHREKEDNSRPKHREKEDNSRLTYRSIARPVSVSIPALQLQEDLVELNVISGVLQVPTDYAEVGWWRDGPAPGAPGSAVLVGHVDSPTAPAVFYELSSIQIGDEVVIRRADGTKAAFRVTDATLYPRESFPSSRVYRENGRPTLTLVTCGGSYDRAAGHYTDNLVVTTHPVNVKRR